MLTGAIWIPIMLKVLAVQKRCLLWLEGNKMKGNYALRWYCNDNSAFYVCWQRCQLLTVKFPLFLIAVRCWAQCKDAQDDMTTFIFEKSLCILVTELLHYVAFRNWFIWLHELFVILWIMNVLIYCRWLYNRFRNGTWSVSCKLYPVFSNLYYTEF